MIFRLLPPGERQRLHCRARRPAIWSRPAFRISPKSIHRRLADQFLAAEVRREARVTPDSVEGREMLSSPVDAVTGTSTSSGSTDRPACDSSAERCDAPFPARPAPAKPVCRRVAPRAPAIPRARAREPSHLSIRRRSGWRARRQIARDMQVVVNPRQQSHPTEAAPDRAPPDRPSPAALDILRPESRPIPRRGKDSAGFSSA